MIYETVEMNVILALLAAGFKVRSVSGGGRPIIAFEDPQGEASAIADAAMKDSQGALVEALAVRLGLMDQPA